MLNKEKTLYITKDGELVPQEVELIEPVDEKIESIMAIPVPRKKLKEILRKNKDKGDNEDLDKDTDAEIVSGFCKNPAYSEEEISNLKPAFCKNIAATILDMSGLSMKNTFDEIKKQIIILCFGLNKDEKKQIAEVISSPVKESKEVPKEEK